MGRSPGNGPDLSIQSPLCLICCYFCFIPQEEMPCPFRDSPHPANSQCLLPTQQPVSHTSFQLDRFSDLPRSARQEMPTPERNSSHSPHVSQQTLLINTWCCLEPLFPFCPSPASVSVVAVYLNCSMSSHSQSSKML